MIRLVTAFGSRRGGLALVLVLLFGLTAAPLHAQSPPALAKPDLALYQSGTVFALARLPNGDVVIGGSFSSVYDPGTDSVVARSNLARITADGSLDLEWNPGADGSVQALAADESGDVYVGGSFATAGGQPRAFLAKLSGVGTGAADPSWNPAPNNTVRSIGVDQAGAVFIGGSFTQVGGSMRFGLARIEPSGATDLLWNPAPTSGPGQAAFIDVLALDGSSALYVGGNFNTIGGQNRYSIAKLSTAGAGSADANWNPSVNSQVDAIWASPANGAVYVSGGFTMSGGLQRNGLAKLSGSGSGATDPMWNPNPAPNAGFRLVTAISPSGPGSILVGGRFTSISGQSRGGLARIDAAGTGSADLTWSPAINSGFILDPQREVYSLVVDQGSGVVVVSGFFSLINGQIAMSVARLASGDGSVLPSPLAQVNGQVRSIAVATDGSSYVGGDFQRAGKTTRPSLLKLTAERELDPAWNPSAHGNVSAVVAASDQDLIVGGAFTYVGGQVRRTIAKISMSGSGAADPIWDPSGRGIVLSLAGGPGGNVYVGGLFDSMGGLSRNGLAKLSTTGAGAADPTWNPSPNAGSSFPAITVSNNGDVYVGGFFFTIGGLPRAGLAKLSGVGTGATDPQWDPSPGFGVETLAMHPSGGSIFIGGSFTSIGGQGRLGLAKLSASGSGAADPLWNPVVTGGRVLSIAHDATTGMLFVGGDFTSVAGQPRPRLALLSGEGAGILDMNWSPGASASVRSIALNGQGSVLVGGFFTSAGGRARYGIAALPRDSNVIFADDFE